MCFLTIDLQTVWHQTKTSPTCLKSASLPWRILSSLSNRYFFSIAMKVGVHHYYIKSKVTGVHFKFSFNRLHSSWVEACITHFPSAITMTEARTCWVHTVATHPQIKIKRNFPKTVYKQTIKNQKNSYKQGTGEMAQWVKNLLPKHEELSLDPRNPSKA